MISKIINLAGAHRDKRSKWLVYEVNTVIGCEHNFTENRNKIYQLLSSSSYAQVLMYVSFFGGRKVCRNLAGAIKI